MNKTEFQQQLILNAVRGLCSNPFFWQQMAVLDATSMEKIEVDVLTAKIAVLVAQQVVNTIPEELQGGDRDAS